MTERRKHVELEYCAARPGQARWRWESLLEDLRFKGGSEKLQHEASNGIGEFIYCIQKRDRKASSNSGLQNSRTVRVGQQQEACGARDQGAQGPEVLRLPATGQTLDPISLETCQLRSPNGKRQIRTPPERTLQSRLLTKKRHPRPSKLQPGCRRPPVLPEPSPKPLKGLAGRVYCSWRAAGWDGGSAIFEGFDQSFGF